MYSQIHKIFIFSYNINGDYMLLKDIYKDINYNTLVTGVTTDSRYVLPGNLFLPLPGRNFEGHEFIIEAANKNASAIISDKIIKNATIPVIIVDDIYKELERLIEIFYGKPYNDLTLIGITGTDGKTTTSTITSYLLSHKATSANIGTNGITYNNIYIDNLFTTPPLTENYRLLNNFKLEDIKYTCMEVSSQGITNNRINNILFDYTVFTNLSHEHLDTHITMHNYFLTKLKLFKQLKPNGIMIINKDDPYSKYFEKYTNAIFFSTNSPSDFQAINIKYFNTYTTFDLKTKDYIYENLKVNISEEYNIYNILPAIIISLYENINIDNIARLLENLPIIPGRLEKVPINYPFEAYIDFAHTPNALEKVLKAMRQKTKNNIILVCGAAGNKDKSKRPLMGTIACEYADFVIFTSEDPKCEKPIDIINQMVQLIDVSNNNYQIILNRKNALSYAFQIAKPGDIVLVTGKGRENFFEENNQRIPYSDYEYLQSI